MAQIRAVFFSLMVVVICLSNIAVGGTVDFRATYVEDGFTHELSAIFSGEGEKSIVTIKANSNLLVTSQDLIYLGEWIVSPNDRLQFYRLDFEQLANREKRRIPLTPGPVVPQRDAHSVRITLNGVSLEERQVNKLDGFFDAIKDAKILKAVKATTYKFRKDDVVFQLLGNGKKLKDGSFKLNQFCKLSSNRQVCRLPQGLISHQNRFSN